MLESHKFSMENGNEVTVSELYLGDYVENKVVITMEEVECESMSLILSKKEAWAVGRAMMHLGYSVSYTEPE